MPLDGSSPERILAEDRVLHVAPVGVNDSYFGDVSADGRKVVYAIEDEAHPPDFWVTDPTFRERRRITHLNPHLEEVALGKNAAHLLADRHWRTSARSRAPAGALS